MRLVFFRLPGALDRNSTWSVVSELLFNEMLVANYMFLIQVLYTVYIYSNDCFRKSHTIRLLFVCWLVDWFV